MGPGWLSLVCPKLQHLCQCQGLLGLSEPVVQAPKVPLGLGEEGIPLYTVVCWLQSVVILFIRRYFTLGSWNKAHKCLVKLIGSLGVGTITSSSYQDRVSTQWVCHVTHSLGSSRGGSGISNCSGPSSSPSGGPASDRNFCRCGSKTGGSPRSPLQLGTNLQCHQSYQTMRSSHPPPWAGSGLLFLWFH